MNFTQIIQHLRKLQARTEDKSFRRVLGNIISLLTEIQNKNFTKDNELTLQSEVENQLADIQTVQQAKRGYKILRKILMRDFGFIPSNYYLSLGMGIGVAIGTSLGISFGVPFNNGIVYGQIMGSGIGVIAGLIVGRILDKRKEYAGLILRSL
jgi:hypothetical protein